jgi:hypothetical protein
MIAIVADANLPFRLKTLTEPVEVVDEAGHTLGYYQPDGFAGPGIAAARSPNSNEKLQELRKQQEGGLPCLKFSNGSESNDTIPTHKE